MDRNFQNRYTLGKIIVVALRKESVDRNNMVVLVLSLISLVALRKESVDRNESWASATGQMVSRSPQGERG